MITQLKCLSAALLAAGIVGGSPVAFAQQEEVTILIPNNNTTGFFPLNVARELGFFEDEGITVTPLPSETTVPYVAFLANGQADVSMLDAPQVLQARNADQPVKVVYEFMKYAPEMVFTKAEGEIKTIADLEGKTVGMASDRDRVTLQVALDTAGIDIDAVNTVVVGENPVTIQRALAGGDVDAIAAGVNEAALVSAAGTPVLDLTPAAVSKNPANSFAIYGPRTEEIREEVTGFLRAWSKGAEAVKIDRETVAAILRQTIPEEWEAEEDAQNLLEASIKQVIPPSPTHGTPEPEVWSAVQEPYVKFGMIEERQDPAEFLDDSFYEAANDFDRSEIEAALAEWKANNPDAFQPR